jgi:pyruvate dehydrogenase complex dehydrogenase (E1) component
MPKIVKIFLISNLTLAIIASLVAGYYFLSGGHSSSTAQKALSNQNGLADQSTDTVVEGKDIQVVAKYDSSSDKEVKVILEDGSEAVYSSSELFYLCRTANSEIYDSLKQNNASIIDASYIIKAEDLETKLKKGEEIELFLYFFESGEIPVKGIVSLGC